MISLLPELELPGPITTSLLVASGAVVTALLKYFPKKQEIDDKREMNLANEFRSRLEHVESELKHCLKQHSECNERVRRLEVAQDARAQNDVLHQQILAQLTAIATDVASGRAAAVAELKAAMQPPPQSPP